MGVRLTPAQTNARRWRDRKANDPLTDEVRDRVILDAIDAGGDYQAIQAALDAARQRIVATVAPPAGLRRAGGLGTTTRA